MKVILLSLLLCGVSLAQAPSTPEGTRPEEMASLMAATLVAAPENALAGEQVHVTLTVVNESATAAHAVHVVLSANAKRIASTTIEIAGSARVDVPFSWTPSSPGAWHLTAQIDPERRLMESSRANDAASLELAVDDASLKSSALSASNLESVSDKGGSVLRVRVTNLGAVPAGGAVVFRVAGRVAASRYLNPIPPGESALVEVPVAHQPPASRVSAEVNPRVAKGNTLSRDIGFANDLRIEALSLHASKFEDSHQRRVTISFRIVNAGRDPVTKAFRTVISPGVVKSGVPVTDSLVTSGLAPGAAVYVSRTLEGPPAEFDVRVETDVDHITGDGDPSNNVAIARYENPSPNVDRWVSLGPRRIDGEGGIGAVGALFQLAIDPKTPATIYVGGNGEGIWKTSDAGANWQPITDALPTLRSSALALDPSNPSQLYLLAPDKGFFKSSDGGGSWNTFDTPAFHNSVAGLSVLKVHPAHPNLLMLTSNDGLYTYDANATQAKWTLPLNLAPANDLVVDPSIPNTMYATLTSPATGIYTSEDLGAHWRKSLGCPGAPLPATDTVQFITLAFAGSSMYAAFKSDKTMEVYRTTGVSCMVGSQRESSWEKRYVLTGCDSQGNCPANDLWNRIDADPATPNVVYLSGTVFRVSTDGGQTFSIQSGTQPHADHHGLMVNPAAPENIYVVCDGGIYRSSNRGAANSWQFVGEGILNVQFYSFSHAETDPTLIIGGTQDNGTLAYTGSTIWSNINGGDGATTSIDPTNSQIQYSMNQGPDSMVKRVGNGSWKPIACGIPVSGSCFNLFFQLDPATPTTVLASCVSLFKTDSPVCTRGPNWNTNDTGNPNVWTELLPKSTVSGNVIRSAVDRTLTLYYAGTSAGEVWAGPSGANWQRLFLGGGAVSDIKIDLDEPTTLYVSMIAGSSSGRIYRMKRVTSAPTASTVTTVDITSNLPPGLNVSAVAIDRMNPLTLYAGTNQGVYRGQFGPGLTWTWSPYLNGMPLADVRGMEVQPRTGVLRAATFGRGVYEVNTGDPIGSLLSAAGKITFLRVNDLGSGFGPPADFLDAEVILQLDSQPGKSFGFQLRADGEEPARAGMLELLRSAFRKDRSVSIDYTKTGLHNGAVIRVAKTN